MRYQIRLVDQNLPGLAREISYAAWEALGDALSESPGPSAYRTISRAVRAVMKENVLANRFCGAARSCEHSLEPKKTAVTFDHEAYPQERIHIFLLDGNYPPEKLRNDLEARILKAAAEQYPQRKLRGLGPALRNRIERIFHGRMFRSDPCGESPLCAANEPFNPWDVTDPTNALKG